MKTLTQVGIANFVFFIFQKRSEGGGGAPNTGQRNTRFRRGPKYRNDNTGRRGKGRRRSLVPKHPPNQTI